MEVFASWGPPVIWYFFVSARTSVESQKSGLMRHQATEIGRATKCRARNNRRISYGAILSPWYMYMAGCTKKHSLTSKKLGMAWYQRHIVELVYLAIQREIYQLSRLFRKLLIWASWICINYVYWLKLWVLFVCYYIVIFDEKMKLVGYDLHIRTQKNLHLLWLADVTPKTCIKKIQ